MLIHKSCPVKQLDGSLKAEHGFISERREVLGQGVALLHTPCKLLLRPCEALKPHLSIVQGATRQSGNGTGVFVTLQWWVEPTSLYTLLPYIPSDHNGVCCLSLQMTCKWLQQSLSHCLYPNIA